MPKISILIITYNRAADLLDFLKSLSLQEGIDSVLEETLILNNASTESYNDVVSYLNAHPQIKARYIDSDSNLGVARGRNKLMKIAKGDLLLTVDDDMIFPQPDALLKASLLFEQPLFKTHNTAIITMRVVYYSNKEVQEIAFPHKKYHKYKDRTQFLTYYFSGGANIMKSSVLSQTGLFPENFFYGMEEYDLCYRILDCGYTIGYDGSITLEHKESPSGRHANHQKLRMQWINKSKVAWRYLPFIYFLSTFVLWSFQYLRNAPTHLGLFFKSWLELVRIPVTEKRRPIKPATRKYLSKVEARLWF
ncbi:MAG TPA: glycosyltransferase family 2 protein [Flavisolibacter sp.]|jgi:GT2 family glycosyltransferase